MMQNRKKRIQPYLTLETHRELATYLSRKTNLTESAVVEAALRQYLRGTHDTTLLFRHLGRISAALERNRQDQEINSEFIHQWVKLWLRNTPRLNEADGQANLPAAKQMYRDLRRELSSAVGQHNTLIAAMTDLGGWTAEEPSVSDAERGKKAS